MQQESHGQVEAPARALAMLVAADGRIDDRELRVLDELDAFRRLGVNRERFVDLVHACITDVGSHLCERSWLCDGDMAYVDALLDAVVDADQRLLVCQLASAVISANGRQTHDERLVHSYALARWHISEECASRASPHGQAR